MSALYSLLVYLAAPFALLYFLWRSLREPTYRDALVERLGLGAAAPSGGVWVHAVSVGEVRAALPLVNALRVRHPDRPLLMTTTTAGGREVAIQALGHRATVRYLPLDLPGAVGRFLDRHQPVAGVIVETEIWPNLFRACASRGVPLLIANARMSEGSERSYRRLQPLLRRSLESVLMIAAQSEEDAARFVRIGAPPERTRVVGNLKFDIEVEQGMILAGRAWRAAGAPGRAVWVAGSTHAGEESEVLRAHRSLLAQRPDALLVLAPRHPARFEEVAALLSTGGWRWQRKSGAASSLGGVEVLLLDTLGELVRFYAAADLAFVGGSLVPIGGHNLLEPVAVGCPTVTGPHNFHSAQVYTELSVAGGLTSVGDGQALGEAVVRLFGNSDERAALSAAGMRVLDANRGAVARLMGILRPVFKPDPET